MNRRNFFRQLGGVAVAAVVVPIAAALPKKYGHGLKEHVVQAQNASLEFTTDTNSGWYQDGCGCLKFVNCGHTVLNCDCHKGTA